MVPPGRQMPPDPEAVEDVVSTGEAGVEGIPAHSARRPVFSLRPDREKVNPYAGRLHEYPDHIVSADEAKGRAGTWREVIRPWDEAAPDAPLFLEIGPGNGFFIQAMAQRHPEAAILGLEIRYKRVWLCGRKLSQVSARSARVAHYHAGHLRDVVAAGELDRVYVNHPDPWPKKGHHRNRLVNPAFTAILGSLLRPGGTVTLKSDFYGYLPVMRDAFSEAPFDEVAFAEDLHRDGGVLFEENIETNYEAKTLRRGDTVFALRFRRRAL